MMSQEENRRYTQVGAGTPMGELLRRYWHPVAGISELEDNPIKPIRIMGEDLVLYKDKSGNFGLIDRHCPHRRADLAYGIVEECGIRCSYHGWKMNHEGRCLEQPYEDVANPAARFREKIRVKAYKVKALAGMLFVYMGPDPAPEVPLWEPLTWTNGFRQIVAAKVPCNWLQCQENSCDPVHFEWAHVNWVRSMKNDDPTYGPRHLELKFEEYEFGHVYKRVREDTDKSNEHWTIGAASLFPNAFFLGDHIEWRVPIDDENTLSLTWSYTPVPKEQHPYVQGCIPYWEGPVVDPHSGRWITSHIMNQDFVAWVGQGTITDRTKEHLGRSDLGVIMMRKAFKRGMEAVEKGEDPMGVVRDQKRNQRGIELPTKSKHVFTDPLSLNELKAAFAALAYPAYEPDYVFQAGMPEEVKQAYHQAIMPGEGKEVIGEPAY